MPEQRNQKHFRFLPSQAVCQFSICLKNNNRKKEEEEKKKKKKLSINTEISTHDKVNAYKNIMQRLNSTTEKLGKKIRPSVSSFGCCSDFENRWNDKRERERERDDDDDSLLCMDTDFSANRLLFPFVFLKNKSASADILAHIEKTAK